MRFVLPALLLLASASPSAAIELALPIDCTIGTDCVVQHYVDRDPGGDRRDYMCTHQTYDGHDGVDIRVPTLRAMEAGVAVLAAADGTVVATRDGMADRNVADTGVDAVKDVECGNGVLVAHADGWQTQYCHLKNGSIRVAEGDAVRTGTPLGEVGLSGMTEFPHVHFTVREGDTEVDPFATAASGAGAACTLAGDAGTGLWTPEAEAALAYRPAFVLNAGFAEAPVEMEQIEAGGLEDAAVTRQSPALVFYGRAIGLEEGDVQRVVITAPDGSVFAESEIEPLDRAKAQYMAFTGKKLRDAAWPPGTWRGRYSVIRNGDEVAFRAVELELPE